jgi:hypothetical protein
MASSRNARRLRRQAARRKRQKKNHRRQAAAVAAAGSVAVAAGLQIVPVQDSAWVHHPHTPIAYAWTVGDVDRPEMPHNELPGQTEPLFSVGYAATAIPLAHRNRPGEPGAGWR